MRSALVLLAVFVALFVALAQCEPRPVIPFRQASVRNPKRESSSLILGGRFGRSCFFQAGGCLGKRSEPQKQHSFNLPENSPFFNQMLSNLESLNENDRYRNTLSTEDGNPRDLTLEDYMIYK